MYCIILSKLYTLLYNINDNPRHTKPKWAIKRHTTDRFHLFDPHRISSLSTTAPDDFDNSPLGHSTTTQSRCGTFTPRKGCQFPRMVSIRLAPVLCWRKTRIRIIDYCGESFGCRIHVEIGSEDNI